MVVFIHLILRDKKPNQIIITIAYQWLAGHRRVYGQHFQFTIYYLTITSGILAGKKPSSLFLKSIDG